MTKPFTIKAYRGLQELDALEAAWEELRKQQRKFFPSFDDARIELQHGGRDFCAVAVAVGDSIVGIACFLLDNRTKQFSVGELALFRLPVREIRLYGQAILGNIGQDLQRQILRFIADQWPFDLIVLGEIEIDSPLHRAAASLGCGLAMSRPSTSVHWLIDLPDTFDGFLQQLRASTRSSVARKLKKFECSHDYEFHIVSRPDQVERFLRDGEKISRRTYQWNVGQRLQNDEPTRQRYLQFAHEDRLRCYLLYVDGEPCAFVRGKTNGAVYYFETPGFDPRFEKSSPGTILLMWALRDLIENCAYKVFDFGQGGDATGYKSRFSNSSCECVWIEICNLYAPYSLALWLIHNAVLSAKAAVRFMIGRGQLHRRLRKSFRKYGDAEQ
ncbi:MAG: GNAT family N-acetyltransferase [Methylocella sp.]